ncbi:hypothetical protein FOMPIDRAFT_1052978 [Fomitopsis schrenkii]|uniref:Uncharacterized protein n=1 Tax=Fomitopsis schrenkii TaxID=2126942 RepID=S8E0G0_FOMSC|nr:hypothetical protein FOMPIDRAFT_1052978 [Fomitopsis schrenkii]
MDQDYGPPGTPSSTSKAKPSPASKSKRPAVNRGVGSKSGEANRRERGISDDEIAELSAAQREAASLKRKEVEVEEGEQDEEEGDEVEEDEDEEDQGSGKHRGLTDFQKRVIVEYITSPEVYKTRRVRMSTIATHLVYTTFKKAVTVKQVTNFWNGVWDRYKACRTREEHTGGGDGDEGRPGVGGRERKFSDKVLDKFERSHYYQLIDAVAHDDESVVRMHDVNSGEAIKNVGDDAEDTLEQSDGSRPKKRQKRRSADDDDEDGSDHFFDSSHVIRDAVVAMREKHEQQATYQQSQLDIMRRQEERAEREYEERRREREEERRHSEADRKASRRESRAATMLKVSEMLGSQNPGVVSFGLKLMEQLKKEEEADG